MSRHGEASPLTPSAAKVSVAVVDDNPVVRMGLRAIVEASDALTFVGEAGDGEAAIAMVRRCRPDVTLLDVRMPRRDGIAVLAAVRDVTSVLMLTYSDGPDVIRAALAEGALGYLVHGHFSAPVLERSILMVRDGAFPLSAPAVAAMRSTFADARTQPASRPDFGLSAREVEVASLLAEGCTNSEIAARLFVAEKTVKNHINSVFAKMQVRHRSEAILAWLGPWDRDE
jgi:DNA-binding NarL/FixJ family response regulator